MPFRCPVCCIAMIEAGSICHNCGAFIGYTRTHLKVVGGGRDDVETDMDSGDGEPESFFDERDGVRSD